MNIQIKQLTEEQKIDNHFKTCADLVVLINQVIADPTNEKYSMHWSTPKQIVEKNVLYLKNIKNEDWYIKDTKTRNPPKDKASIDAAIVAGGNFINS